MRAALVGASALCVLSAGVVTALDATAASRPGAAFLGYTLTAQASGAQVTEDQPTATTHPEAEAEVPHSQVSLVSGPAGYALSSLAWPGALAANAGSLLVLAGVPVPPETAQQLNYPVRAETRTGGPQQVTNDQVPGAVMTAEVRPGTARADSTVDGAEAGRALGLGRTTTSSSAELGEDRATTRARSTTQDVSLAEGAVTFRSLASEAEATTDGTTSSGKGRTVVTGLEVGGVPVSVDSRGVTVAGASTPIDPTARATVEQVLAQLGMRIVLSAPSSTRQGGAVSYDAGSLVVVWRPPGSPNVMTAVFGGARVTASAFLADPARGAVPPPVVAEGTGAAPVVPGQAPLPAVGGPVPVSPGLGTPGTPVRDPMTAPLSAALSEPLAGGTTAPASAVALCVLAALLLLGGLLRLPGAVLATAAPPTCTARRSP